MERRRRPVAPRRGDPRSGIRFRPDPRVPEDHQTLDPVYADNRLDRGHVARRADLLWGPLEEALRANSDSFHFTNITPQMDDFNQERLGGSWGMLEAAILSAEGLRPRRLTLFGGPVLGADDPPYRGLVRIPREHWKVVVYRLDGALRYRCFLLTQQVDPDLRGAVGYLDEFDTWALPLPDLASRTGLTFPGLTGATGDPARADADTPVDAGREDGARLVLSALDVRW
ncbi:DNA/RNA non-specific endonuclease [Oryzobacter sp. R7]|uniref:DNA/RNA non-specific endonuclease n=1 Tax=Oryzobacter faecalis TaxID=3388656 RepID=UPI00398D1517